jgi:hypothetical protein
MSRYLLLVLLGLLLQPRNALADWVEELRTYSLEMVAEAEANTKNEKNRAIFRKVKEGLSSARIVVTRGNDEFMAMVAGGTIYVTTPMKMMFKPLAASTLIHEAVHYSAYGDECMADLVAQSISTLSMKSEGIGYFPYESVCPRVAQKQCGRPVVYDRFEFVQTAGLASWSKPDLKKLRSQLLDTRELELSVFVGFRLKDWIGGDVCAKAFPSDLVLLVDERVGGNASSEVRNQYGLEILKQRRRIKVDAIDVLLSGSQ